MKNLQFEYEIEVNALEGSLYKTSSAVYKDLLINKYVKDMDNVIFTIFTFEDDKGYLKRNTKKYKNIKEEMQNIYKDCIVNEYFLRNIRGIEVIKIKK